MLGFPLARCHPARKAPCPPHSWVWCSSQGMLCQDLSLAMCVMPEASVENTTWFSHASLDSLSLKSLPLPRARPGGEACVQHHEPPRCCQPVQGLLQLEERAHLHPAVLGSCVWNSLSSDLVSWGLWFWGRSCSHVLFNKV